MTAHDNISVPSESWPNWIWYAMEFAIVFAVSMVISWKISDAILYNVADAIGHADALESWSGVTILTKAFQDIPDEVEGKIVAMSNWIFYAMFAGFFGVWYLGLRRIVLKIRTFS